MPRPKQAIAVRTVLQVTLDRIDQIDRIDLTIVPASLSKQCRFLIESFHRTHGYSPLPDLLWKSGLGPFIESQRELRQLLKQASMSRSAKRANDGFVRIATTILALEILASSFAGWASLYPEAALIAHTLLKPLPSNQQMPLMAFYLYPQQPAALDAITMLAPPLDSDDGGAL